MLFRRSSIPTLLLFLLVPLLQKTARGAEANQSASTDQRTNTLHADISVTPTVPKKTPPSTVPAQITVQLIRVRSDWSKVKDAEDVKKALESLVADMELPDRFHENLLGTASQILFPERFLSVYAPDRIAALLAWMTERDLIRIEAESQPVSPPSEGMCEILADHEIVPIIRGTFTDDSGPFVKRTYMTTWTFESQKVSREGSDSPSISFTEWRVPGRREEFTLNQPTKTETTGFGTQTFEASFPADRVAVAHALFVDPLLGEYARTKGWDPVLVIRPADLANESPHAPELAKPESLLRISAGFSPPMFTIPDRFEMDPAIWDNPPQGKLLQVFLLKHAHAKDLADLLYGVMPDATFAADERTNSLIVTATEKQFAVIEVLIQKLDTAPIGHEDSGKTETPQSIETARDDYHAKQKEAASVVRSLTVEEDEEAAGELRARLKRLVSEAFDLRQKLQRAELTLLKERMQIVETRLQQRETLRKQIIERRVESLLAGGDDSGTTGLAATPAVPSPTTTRRQTHSDTAAPDKKRVNLGTSWVDDDVILSLVKGDREAAWGAAFKQQREKNPWPVQLSPEFQKCLRTIRDSADIPDRFLDEYWNFVKKQAPEIDGLIDRRRPNRVDKTSPGAKEGAGAMSGYGAETVRPELIGIVEWNESDYARIQQGFYWVQRPSTIQVRLAQEDLWCYEAILRAIAKTNKDARATTYFDAAIDRIETLAIGQPAAQAMGASRPRRAHSAYFGTPPSKVVPPVEKEAELGFAPAAPLNTGLGGIPVLKDVAERLLTGRYVDLTGTPLAAHSKRYPEFNLLPVQLVVDLQESRLPDLLNNLAVSAMPLDVICVDVSGTPKVKPVEEADPRIRAEILGMIRIFNPPDVKELDASVVKPGTVQDILVRMGFRDQPWKDVLQWLADTAGLQLNVIGKMPEGTFTHVSSDPLTLEEARRIVAGKLIFEGYAVYFVQDGDRDCFLVQETASGQAKRRATEAAEDVAKWTKALVEEDRQDDEAYLATVKRRLDEAEKRLAAERQNVAQMVGRSQLNLQKAQASLESARQELETTRKLQAKGYVKQAELDALEQEVQRRSDQAVMCQADDELYRAAAEVLGLTPADIEKAKIDLGKSSEMMDEVLGIVADDPVKTTPPQISVSTAGVGTRASLPLRTPEDFVTAASDAKTWLLHTQRVLREFESQPADQDDDPSKTAARLNELKEDVATALRRLEIIQAEYAAQLRLRSLELQSAQADADAAQSELEREESLFKMGRLPVDEVQKTRLKHEQAKLRVQAAETLLELFNKAGESPDLKPLPKIGSEKTDDDAGDSETVEKPKENPTTSPPPSSKKTTP